MAEFCEVMKQAKRMCDTYSKVHGSCECCPFDRFDHCPADRPLEWLHEFRSMESIVRGWAENTPEPQPMTQNPTDLVTSDAVHHPTHYNADGGMECIEEMLLVFGREAVMHFCACNVWKYRYRANGKDGEKDLQKAHEYMRIYERLKKGKESE